MKLVHFGAGNIGRGAIPEIFKNVYSHITFIDPNIELVNKINSNHSYTIFNSNPYIVNNFSAVHFQDNESIIKELINADVISTSCGINNLVNVANILNQDISFKNKPIIIAFENNIRATSQLKEMIINKNNFIFMDCTIDRIVPKTSNLSNLDLTTENYLSVVIENINNIKNEFFINCTLTDNLDKYINLKLFCVNGIHFLIAILTYNEKYKYIHEFVKSDKIIKKINLFVKNLIIFLKNTFLFDEIYLNTFINTVIERFKNPVLNDECIRVARNPLLKLSPSNRITPVFKYYFLNNNDNNNSEISMNSILLDLFSYNNPDDNESVEMQNIIKEKGLKTAIKQITGLKI